MQTHQRKSSMAIWLACGLLLLAALALPGTQATTRAQEAPNAAAKPAIFNEQELRALEAYIQGDCGGAFERTSSILAKAVENRSPRNRALLALLMKLSNELGNKAELSDKLKRIQSGPFERVEALRQSAAHVEADELSSRVGYLKNWWVCGPFANERGQGFDEPQGPELEFDLDKVYTGKNGQECRWQPLPRQPVDGIVDLGTMFRPNTEAVAYLITVVRGTGGAAVELSASSDGPIWVGLGTNNGSVPNKIIETTAERELGLTQNYVSTTAGSPAVVMLKTAATETGWRVRVAMMSGYRKQGGETAPIPEGSGRQELEVALAKCVGSKFTAEFERETATATDPLWLAIREVLAPSEDRNSGSARRMLEAILADFFDPSKGEPKLSGIELAVFTFLLAEASKSTSRVASGKEENKRRELLEQVLKLDPKAARAALELAKYYSGTFRNPTEADRYAKMAVQLAPKWVEARVFAARVATMKGLEGEVERELAALLKDHPNHPSVLRFAGYYRGLRGDYVGSDELFKRCLEKGDFTDEYCRERLFTRAVERNDAEAALKYANETRQLNPFDLASSEGLIQLFLATGDLERAMGECERALNICPREDKFLARKGEIYMRMAAREPAKAADFKAKAIAAYHESLKCNPNNEDLARYLEFLADEKPLWEVKLQENIEARIEAALKLPVDGNDPYRVIYRDEITVVNDDGTKSIYFQYAYRICNDDGREVLQELGAPAYSDQVGRCVGARVYRRDGGTEEGRRVESQAMLPPLDVGDIVAVRYRVSDTAQSFFGDFFGAIETLGDNVPVDEVRLVYVLPKTRKFFEYSANGAPKAERREEGDKTIWTYIAKNLARVPRESNQLPLTQIVPTVQVSTYETWKDFGRWYYNLIKKQLEPTPEMRAKVASLIQGKTSEREKARAIYNWVVTNVRYNADWHFGVHGYKPFSAGAIFERCIGDCKDKAIVICTMLGIAGVKAYPVLIRLADSSDPRGREDITLPMPHHFNHAIAYIEYTDGKGQFVDGTATFNGFDELPGGDSGAHVIIVRPEGGEQTQIPAPAPAQNAAIEEASLEFLGNGKVKLSVKLTATGDRASFLRAIYLQSGTRATQIENQWARHKPGAKVLKVEANDLANIDLAPEVKYEIEIPDAYSTDAQGNIEIAAALNPLLFAKGMAAATTRRTDIAMNEPYQWHSTVRIKLPEGRTLEKAASLVDSALGVSLSVSVEVIDREIVVTRTYASSGGVIAAADYTKLRAMMLAHDRAEATKLRLVKE